MRLLFKSALPRCRNWSVSAPASHIGFLYFHHLYHSVANQAARLLLSDPPFSLGTIQRGPGWWHDREGNGTQKNVLSDGDNWAGKGRMTLATATPTCQIPVLLRNICQPFAYLLFREVRYIQCRLMDASFFIFKLF